MDFRVICKHGVPVCQWLNCLEYKSYHIQLSIVIMSHSKISLKNAKYCSRQLQV